MDKLDRISFESIPETYPAPDRKLSHISSDLIHLLNISSVRNELFGPDVETGY